MSYGHVNGVSKLSEQTTFIFVSTSIDNEDVNGWDTPCKRTAFFRFSLHVGHIFLRSWINHLDPIHMDWPEKTTWESTLQGAKIVCGDRTRSHAVIYQIHRLKVVDRYDSYGVDASYVKVHCTKSPIQMEFQGVQVYSVVHVDRYTPLIRHRTHCTLHIERKTEIEAKKNSYSN